MGVPVPAGFTITTDACRAYMAARELPDGLDEEVDEHVAPARGAHRQALRLERRPAARLGALGRGVSMPGMMDTILNLGLNDEAAAGLAARTGNPRFALRLLPAADPDVRRGRRRDRRPPVRERARRRSSASAACSRTPTSRPTTSRELVETFKEIYREETGGEFPRDAREQLMRAVRAVFESWDTPRAQVYRRANDIPDDLGTAVNVVQMVFGNKGDRSGTGVAFTRDPSTGETGSYGEFLANAQGEDVVAGIRTPQPLEAMRDTHAGGVRAARRDDAPARGALPRHAGHRVHRRGRAALPPADARGEAHGGGGAEGGCGDGRRGADQRARRRSRGSTRRSSTSCCTR